MSYILLQSFLVIAALMDTFVGGAEGLLKHYKIILWWPAIFGALRLILMLVFLRKYESPQFYLDNQNLDQKEISEKLRVYFNSVYTKDDAEISIELKLSERREEIQTKTLGSGLIQLFSKRSRKKFIFGILLHQYR